MDKLESNLTSKTFMERKEGSTSYEERKEDSTSFWKSKKDFASFWDRKEDSSSFNLVYHILLCYIPCNTDEKQDFGPDCSLNHGLVLFYQLQQASLEPSNAHNDLMKRRVKEFLVDRSNWVQKFLLRFPCIFSTGIYTEEIVRGFCSGIEFIFSQPDLEELKKKFQPLFDRINTILKFFWKDIGIFVPHKPLKNYTSRFVIFDEIKIHRRYIEGDSEEKIVLDVDDEFFRIALGNIEKITTKDLENKYLEILKEFNWPKMKDPKMMGIIDSTKFNEFFGSDEYRTYPDFMKHVGSSLKECYDKNKINSLQLKELIEMVKIIHKERQDNIEKH